MPENHRDMHHPIIIQWRYGQRAISLRQAAAGTSAAPTLALGPTITLSELAAVHRPGMLGLLFGDAANDLRKGKKQTCTESRRTNTSLLGLSHGTLVCAPPMGGCQTPGILGTCTAPPPPTDHGDHHPAEKSPGEKGSQSQAHTAPVWRLTARPQAPKRDWALE